MINTIDVAFCRDLITRVGAQLLAISKREDHALNWDGMYSRFIETNTWAENEIKSALTEKYPAIKWSTAEFEPEKLQSPEFEEDYWMCDPIDGAINFLQGLPNWATSLCLIHNGQPQFSLVYDACQKELFSASAGEGTFLNGKPIQVSQKQNIANAILATSHPSNIAADTKDTQRTTSAIAQVLSQTFALRVLGSVSLQLAYVAGGRLDGFWEYGQDLHDWLAGSFLVREANGTVTDMQSNSFTWGALGIVAASPMIQQELKNKVAPLFN
jgi:myo-inositol-1(or 4)-monophosphatase